MAEVIFNYEGNITTIQCNLNDKMKEVINNFLNKVQEKGDNLFYLYNGTRINMNLSFNELANDIDKNRKKMNVIVSKIPDDSNENKVIVSKDVICPECKENALINFNKYKINLHGCKNNHNINNILLDKYEESQKIDISEIKCNICNINNKSNTHNNEFYICNTCNKNICPLCKLNHNKNHIIS